MGWEVPKVHNPTTEKLDGKNKMRQNWEDKTFKECYEIAEGWTTHHTDSMEEIHKTLQDLESPHCPICQAKIIKEEGKPTECENPECDWCGVESMKADVKGKKRAVFKYVTKYKMDARFLTDLQRHSFQFDTIKELVVAYKKMFTIDGVKIVNKKNRFLNPGASGYADILLNVQLEQTSKTGEVSQYICEVQLHLKEILKIKNETIHTAYERLRIFKDIESVFMDKLYYLR